MGKRLHSNYQTKIITSAGALLLLLTLSAKTFAQDKLTIKDAKEISLQATETVKRIPALLNFITDPNNVPSDLIGAEHDSYKQSRNRLFYSKDIIVEDDIDPQGAFGNVKDVSLEKYLDNLDVQYEKNADPTISFNNVIASGIKKNDYIYVNVKFDSQFDGRNKILNSVYKTRQRQALVRMQNAGNGKWDAFVMGVGFYDASKPIDATDNNVVIYSDTSSTATVVTQEDFTKERDSFIQQKELEEKNKQSVFDDYVKLGDAYIQNKQYKEALEVYQKASDVKSFVPAIDKKILDTKRLVAENTYDKFKNKGDKAKGERRFDEAIQFYQQALTLKPEASAEITGLITPLTSHLSIIALPKNKLGSGMPEEAIDESDKLLRDHKKDKADFPELYFIKAKAYQLINARKPDDTKSIDRALENFNLAVSSFPNYLDARIARADFLVQYKSDYAGAIADYDILTLNALDDSPDKPVYLVQRAKWKDRVQNYPSAIDDYNKALALNPNGADIYFNKGEMQYRLSKFDDAQKCFDAALKLNPKYGNAYYYRGLNFVALRNNSSAGIDFVAVEKLGFAAGQQQKIDSISNAFFYDGDASYKKHDFAAADTAFNNALKIRKCNALALHGKADVRLAIALELPPKQAAARSNYLASIDLNTQAVGCKPDFSDAYYKRGVAHTKLKNYDDAIASYTEAIKSDTSNSQAYVGRGDDYQIQHKFNIAADDYAHAIYITKATYEIVKKASRDDYAKALLFDLSRFHQLRAQALYNDNDFARSFLAVSESLNYNDNNAEALYYRGLVHVKQNELSKSFKDYEAALKLALLHKYFYAYGDASYTYKNYEQAISNYTSAIALDTFATVKNRYYLRGMSYFKNKDINGAMSDFAAYEKAGVQKSDSSFYGDYGLCKLYAGQDTSAMNYLTNAAKLHGNDANALYSLGCAYAKTGQFDKALEYFDKALATRQLTRDDLKLPENTFLVELYKQKPIRNKYNQLKKQYETN